MWFQSELIPIRILAQSIRIVSGGCSGFLFHGDGRTRHLPTCGSPNESIQFWICVCVPGAHAPLKLLPQHLGFLGLFWCQILGTYQWMWGKKKNNKKPPADIVDNLRGTWTPVISTGNSSSRESLHMFHAYFKQGSQEPQSFFQDRCKE